MMSNAKVFSFGVKSLFRVDIVSLCSLIQYVINSGRSHYVSDKTLHIQIENKYAVHFLNPIPKKHTFP